MAAVDPQKYKACGINALYECARIRGNRATFDAVYELLKPGADGTNTLAEIAAAAEKLGYAPVAVNLTFEALASMPTPSIVHVRELVGQGEGNHFVVYLGSTSKQESVCLDAPQGPRIMSKSSFNARWTGDALILCESPDEASQLRSHLDVPCWHDAKLWSATGAVLTVVVGMLIVMELSRR